MSCFFFGVIDSGDLYGDTPERCLGDGICDGALNACG
jgi:hypothetical protein